MTLTTERRYKALPTAKGFVLHGGDDRLPVRITLCDTSWLAEVDDGTPAPPPPRRFGLFEIHSLIDCTTAWSMLLWRPRPGPAPEWRIRMWAQQRARRSIAHLVGQQRLGLMHHVDPIVRDVQRAIFASTFATGQLALDEEFYQLADPFLISDIKRYRACALAVQGFGNRWLEEYWVEPEISCWEFEESGPIERICNRLRNWRDLYSDTRRSYSNLNRTLDAMPGGVPPQAVTMLPRAHLERPITDRLELAVFLFSLGRPEHTNSHVFQFARRSEIVLALGRLGQSLGRKLSSRRCADLNLLTQYLSDFPNPHAGGIVSLADKAIRWHREERQCQADTIIAAEGKERPVALPPIPPPDVPGLTFLATVGAICREGLEMEHCIATYVPQALNGECFLFTFKHLGKRATIEVGADGRVRQSCGPRNSYNSAAREGARLLALWGRAFPPCTGPVGAAAREVPF